MGTASAVTVVACHSGDNATQTTRPSTPISDPVGTLGPDAGPFASPTGTAPVRSITGMLDGWNVVSAAPDRYTSDDNALLHDFGQDVTMAFAGKGAPVVIWANLTDPPSNGYTISSANLGFDQRWQPPVEISRVRLAPGPTGPILAAAGDPTTNLIALVTERRDDNGVSTGVDMYLSADGGKGWSKIDVTDVEAYRPTVAISGSNLYVSFLGATNHQLATSVLPPVKRDAKDALDGADLRTMTWAVQAVPNPEGTTAPLGQPVVRADADGKPSVAAEFAASSRNKRVVGFWRPGLDHPNAVTETDATVGATDVVGLVFREADPIVSVSHPTAGSDAVGKVAISPDGGTTFLPPVDVPARDGERAPFGVTMAITAPPNAATSDSTVPATDPPDTTADLVRTVGLAYLPDNADTVDETDGCGLPRLAMSTNLTEWKTCGPIPDDRRDPRSAVRPANVFQGIVAGPDGAFYLPVTNRNTDGTLPAGIVVWRQSVG